MVTTVAETYYSQQVQAVSVARGRAQAAQSTVTLFAGGLMAALSVTTLADRTWWTQVLAIAAVALWLMAAWLYLWAVASPIPEDPNERATNRQELVNKVFQKVRAEAKKIDERQRCANWMALGAVILSLSTFAASIVTDPVQKTLPGTVVVDAGYRSALHALCSKKAADTGLVSGQIVEESLKAQFVEIRPGAGVCGRPGTILQVPRGEVQAVRWQDA
ncbi:hypothetical protein [Streptomyces collinus]|uniref:Uncharacterized protein n=1 Tax=Streptomyces collinus (strain DSM 40733 / Tue 365) TaxID=1214242 RepID=S5V9M2_STRC3|nr:hypothetical protein [Streptomyces collinus]AGS71819.1 hypothetical protein B446_25040 [Streptomyces collinus Tu 365]